MKEICVYEGTTPLFFCSDCPLFLETCTYTVSADGLAMGAECGDVYLCPLCQEDCEHRTEVNQ